MLITARVLESLCKLSKIIDRRYSLTEAAAERSFLENSSTFNNPQIVLLNIISLTRFQARNIQTGHHGD